MNKFSGQRGGMSREVEDPKEVAEAMERRGADGLPEDRALRAQQLFASLTEAPKQAENGARTPPSEELPAASAGAAVAPPAPPSMSTGPRLSDRQIREHLLAARNTSRRIVAAVKAVRVQATATAFDLATIADAIEQALDATNDRLAALEHELLGEAGPAAPAAERAMAQLRSRLGPPAGGGDDRGRGADETRVEP